MIRAGDPTGGNWPVSWELNNSDNGVLFQFVQDVAAGRPLDWSFSPQVYVFPELPISALAFLLAGGKIYGYYVFVAVLNNVLLFLAIFGVLMMLHRTQTVIAVLGRAALAALPLLALPLLGGNVLLAFQLAPTYYFGMYLMVFAAPMLLLARRRSVQVLMACAIVLAAASNPLALVFVFPAFFVVLVARAIKRGLRNTLRPALFAAALVVISLFVRLFAFAPLQGTSPLAYMNVTAFIARLHDLGFYVVHLADDPASWFATAVGATLAVACLIGAILAVRDYLKSHQPPDHDLALPYLALVPLLGIATTFVLLVTNHLYFWLAIVAPICIALMAIPGRWVRAALPVGVAGFVVLALATGAVPNLASTSTYFGYRSSETLCLDEKLPADAHLGYSTFSDGRRVSLTSTHPFRLTSILDTGLPSFWLTNRAYTRQDGGSFFYINQHGGEKPVDARLIIGRFGLPDSTFNCGEGQSVLVYTSPAALRAITDFYAPQRP